MKISLNYLKKFIEIPSQIKELVTTLEDIGIEVKKSESARDDTLLTLELLANRGDHYSYAGIAQELYGRTGWKLHQNSDITPLFLGVTKPVGVEVKTDKCLAYSLSAYSANGSVESLGQSEIDVLKIAGINQVIGCVDACNLVSLEVGQPLHAFDADKVEGQIVIRESILGEKAHLLFTDSPAEIPSGMVVVADDKKILAIAGVIGCETSKPTVNTKKILVESALYDPVAVRKAAKALRIQNQSSMRFERGGDPSLVCVATDKVAVRLKAIGWNMEARSVVKEWTAASPKISLDVPALNDYLKLSITSAEVSQRLGRYGFICNSAQDANKLEVLVPSSRIWDILGVEDLNEEICRSIGYNNIPSEMPLVTPQKTSAGLERNAKKRKVDAVLTGQGFYEIFVDSFYGESQRQSLGITKGHPLWSHVNIVNSREKSFSLLRNNNVGIAVEVVKTNFNLKTTNIKAYEWTRVFHPNSAAKNGLCDEQKVLWGVVTGNSEDASWADKGRAADIFYLKGLVEEISVALGVDLDLHQSNTVGKDDYMPTSTLLHPNRKANILANGSVIGVIGELHPKLAYSAGIRDARVLFLEVDQSILDIQPVTKRYVAPGKIQPINRDVAILMPEKLSAHLVAKDIRTESKLVESVSVKDVFNSEATKGKNAVTFSVQFNPERIGKTTLLTPEINQELERVVAVTLTKYREFGMERR